jgi:hypothetical protein
VFADPIACAKQCVGPRDSAGDRQLQAAIASRRTYGVVNQSLLMGAGTDHPTAETDLGRESASHPYRPHAFDQGGVGAEESLDLAAWDISFGRG